jgi:hypothetical protein
VIGANVAGIADIVAVGILLSGIVGERAVVILTRIDRETEIAVTVVVRVGATVTGVSCPIVIRICLARVIDSRTVVIRTLVFRVTGITIAITIAVHAIDVTFQRGNVEIVNTCLHNRTVTQV